MQGVKERKSLGKGFILGGRRVKLNDDATDKRNETAVMEKAGET
jgi:hypothetical protein